MSKRFNSYGISVLINYLGEELNSEEDVSESVGEYIKTIDSMHSKGISGSISIKPTQIGLSVSQSLMEENYRRIIKHAAEMGIFVWLDMEGADTVDRTIALYLQSGHANSGICIQSYLKRSYMDTAHIVKTGRIIRLVKGAYKPDSNISYTTKTGTTENYRKIMKYLFAHSDRFMLATHDRSLQRQAKRLNSVYKRDVTYAMLNGIDNRYAVEMKKAGEKVAVYIPFGTRWKDYAYRRVTEVGHMSLLLKSLLKSQTV